MREKQLPYYGASAAATGKAVDAEFIAAVSDMVLEPLPVRAMQAVERAEIRDDWGSNEVIESITIQPVLHYSGNAVDDVVTVINVKKIQQNLKACPFCKRACPEYKEGFTSDGMKFYRVTCARNRYLWTVGCLGTMIGISRADVIAKWNKRALVAD